MHQRGELHRWWGGARGTTVLLATALIAACNGDIGSNGGSGGSGGPPVGALAYGPTGLHRLSRIEYDNTLADLLGDSSRAGLRVAARGRQRPVRQRLLHAAGFGRADRVGRDAGDRRRGARRWPTRPSATRWSAARRRAPATRPAWRASCARFGRRAFRRPLTDEEVAGYLGLSAFAVEANDFYVGVELVLRAMLQDPQLPLPRRDRHAGARARPASTGWATTRSATRLSYFLWGSTPVRSAAGHGGRGRAVDGDRPPRRRDRAARRPARRASASSSSTRSGWRTTSCRWRADMAHRDARRDRRAGRRASCSNERGDYFDLFRVDRDLRQRRAGRPTTACRAPAARRGAWVALRRQPAATASCRTARCWPRAPSSTTPAPPCAACSCATGCSARRSRRRRRTWTSTSRRPPPPAACKVDRYAAHRQRRLRQLPQPDRSDRLRPGELRPHRRASAPPTRTTRSARSAATARWRAWAPSTAPPGWPSC